MSISIVRYETTPNPNALKCWMDTPISEGPRSFLNNVASKDDKVASALFEQAGITNLLMNGEWMTISKPPDKEWPAIKKRIEVVLASFTDF